MRNSIIFITKDALRKGALSLYGNKCWHTKNIDELAFKGTIWDNYYTAGGSTAMAFTAMATGKYLFETGRKLYDGNEKKIEENNLFDRLHFAGYDVHIAWDKSYGNFAKTHFKCEGKYTTIHNLDRIIPSPHLHKSGEFDDLTFNNEETDKGLKIILELFNELNNSSTKLFLWLHLPHVFRGRNSYESDIDIFDKIIGLARSLWGDDSIYISADHGQMNGHKNKFSYGYDVAQNVMQIPLITPKFNGYDTISQPVSNTQLAEIFGLEPLKKHDFLYCETAYCAQPMRKMAIIHDNYKLIFDKNTKKFCLYDIEFDPLENLNLFYPEFYDTDRHCWYSLNQRFYYPNWDKAQKAKFALLNKFFEVWKNGSPTEEFKQKIKHFFRIAYFRFKGTKPGKIINIGK